MISIFLALLRISSFAWTILNHLGILKKNEILPIALGLSHHMLLYIGTHIGDIFFHNLMWGCAHICRSHSTADYFDGDGEPGKSRWRRWPPRPAAIPFRLQEAAIAHCAPRRVATPRCAIRPALRVKRNRKTQCNAPSVSKPVMPNSTLLLNFFQIRSVEILLQI